MTELHDFEAEFRSMLVAAERAAQPSDGLADRVIARAGGRRAKVHRVHVNASRRWLISSLSPWRASPW